MLQPTAPRPSGEAIMCCLRISGYLRRRCFGLVCLFFLADILFTIVCPLTQSLSTVPMQRSACHF
ncbi:hypothetical protein DL95DRAFT_387985 [Leptodontidium sp. 2 PMI_412]|nr:hypothetical protein DL95DRAFT_387985 [Leptodontidium sp. 2 PMI_412]